MASFRVEIDCFWGPLDLLLYLVRQQEVDPLDVGLATITAKYLEYMDIIAEFDLEEIGDFLVIASTLLEIKSQQLIPRVDEAEVEQVEEVRQELVKQLLEYKRFKEAGAMLWQRAQEQQRKLQRLTPEELNEGVDPTTQPIRELELWDLVSAFSRLMKENIVPTSSETMQLDTTPITVYMERHLDAIRAAGRITFRTLIGTSNTKVQIICKFLALLELIKQKTIWVEMDEETLDIKITLDRPEIPILVKTDDETGAIPLADSTAPPAGLEGREDHRTDSDYPEEMTAPRAAKNESGDDELEEDLGDDDFIPGVSADPFWDLNPPADRLTPRVSAWEDYEPIDEGEAEATAHADEPDDSQESTPEALSPENPSDTSDAANELDDEDETIAEEDSDEETIADESTIADPWARGHAADDED